MKINQIKIRVVSRVVGFEGKVKRIPLQNSKGGWFGRTMKYHLSHFNDPMRRNLKEMFSSHCGLRMFCSEKVKN
jgi:hypothetical protein